MAIIEVENLTRVFEKRKGKELRGIRRHMQFGKKEFITAVNKVNLKIEKGEIFGLLGPNGAGKTTLIRMLSTLIQPTSGSAKVCGFDIVKEPKEIRKRIGVVGDIESCYWNLTARESLGFWANMYGAKKENVEKLIKKLGLEERCDEWLERFSFGMRKRYEIARALLNNPEVLFLDEPTVGLDPDIKRKLREFVLDLKREGMTILLTTHYIEDAELLCDRVAIINKGKIIACDDVDNLKKLVQNKEYVLLRLEKIDKNIIKKLKNIKGVSSVKRIVFDTIKITTTNADEVIHDVVEMLLKKTKILAIDVVRPSLEDVFLELTGRGIENKIEEGIE